MANRAASSVSVQSVDFLVNKREICQTAFERGEDATHANLQSNQVVLRIDRFGFTSNNIGYAALGESMNYWTFFPAKEGWGRIPVWGFADIIRSRHAQLHEGERLWGYLPMSTHVIVQATNVSEHEFIDASPHRAGRAPIYNRYLRLTADPHYDRASDGKMAVFRPLFVTGFLIDDFLTENSFHGARCLVLSSASSKTALGLAFLLSQHRPKTCTVTGLTASHNLEFVTRTGYYDHVLSYDDLKALDPSAPTAFVDFAGDGAVVRGLHQHLSVNLRYSASVGITHWDNVSSPEELPGPTPEFFSAPVRARKRMGEWGIPVFQMRTAAAMQAFLDSAAVWFRLIERNGQSEIQETYQTVIAGKADPAAGYLLSLHSAS